MQGEKKSLQQVHTSHGSLRKWHAPKNRAWARQTFTQHYGIYADSESRRSQWLKCKNSPITHSLDLAQKWKQLIGGTFPNKMVFCLTSFKMRALFWKRGLEVQAKRGVLKWNVYIRTSRQQRVWLLLQCDTFNEKAANYIHFVNSTHVFVCREDIKIDLSWSCIVERNTAARLSACHQCICLPAVFVVPLRSWKHCAAPSQITVFRISTAFLLILFMRFQCIGRISAGHMFLTWDVWLYIPK